jgi:hypothetical protein
MTEEDASPKTPDPDMPSLEELRFPEILFEVTTGAGDLEAEQCRKHIWWYEMQFDDRDGGQIDKRIYNAYDERISLRTQSIDYSRISEVS